MAKQFETLSAKIEKGTAEKFKTAAQKNKETISGIISKLVNNYISDHEKPLYMCDACNKPLSEGDKYYCELEHLEKIVKSRRGELQVEVWDSKPTRIMCIDCAAKIGKTKRLAKPAKPAHKLRDEAMVKASERRDR